MSIKYYSSLLWRTDTKLSVWILSTKKSITFPREQVFVFCLRIVDDVVFTISSTSFFSLLPLNMPFTHKRNSTGRRFALFQSREVFRASQKNILGSKGGTVVRAGSPPTNLHRWFISWRRCHMWVEFDVGSLLCSERFFLRVLRLSPLLKNQHFQIPIRPGIR